MPAKLVPGLCAKLGLPIPGPDESGAYALALPDGFTVVVTAFRDGMEFSGRVHTLPDAADEADRLCREALTLSLGRTEKEYGQNLPRLAVEGKDLILRQRHAANPSADTFETNVENFVNLLEKWRSLATREQGRQILRAGGGMSGIILP